MYYFRTNKRCVTCRKIEKYTQDVIETEYGPDIKTGRLSFQTINVSENKNKHYIDDYRLITKAVILSRFSQEKELGWKNLDQIWILAGNEKKYKQYIRDSINDMLREINKESNDH